MLPGWSSTALALPWVTPSSWVLPHQSLGRANTVHRLPPLVPESFLSSADLPMQ